MYEAVAGTATLRSAALCVGAGFPRPKCRDTHGGRGDRDPTLGSDMLRQKSFHRFVGFESILFV